MKIIISPAKRMKTNNDFLEPASLPVFLDKAKELLKELQKKSIDELQAIFQTNRRLTLENYHRYQQFDFYGNLTPAVLAFDGIQYTYMAADVFTRNEFEYLHEHLYILSGLYGVLKALDGITPYRLEMQAKMQIRDSRNLYDFWGDSIYNEIFKHKEIVLNLTSEEYKRAIYRYLRPEDRFVSVFFYEPHHGVLTEKAVYAKMARGAMVRYLAVNQIDGIEQVKQFNELGFGYCPELSSENKLVFIRKE